MKKLTEIRQRKSEIISHLIGDITSLFLSDSMNFYTSNKKQRLPFYY